MSATFKIFPATINSEKQKVPLISNWQNLATNDPNQINTWMQMFREKITHWAIPCGPINDLLVLDVDVKNNGFQSVKERNLWLPDTMTQNTLNGGAHFLYRYPKDGKDYGNRIGMFPGVDIRGLGGYIFYYNTTNKPIIDPPPWIMQEAAKERYDHTQPSIKIAPDIAQGILSASIEAIRNAAPGESNNTLNVESFRCGQLVASGAFTREYVEAALMSAAIERKKPPYEAKATIKSGLDGGLAKPLQSPFGEPTISFPIPPPPGPVGRWTPERLTREDLLNVTKLKKPQLFQDWSSEDITITTADGGTGKTTLKLFEAVCLALGDRFLGFNCVQKGRTLFITGEDTDKKLAAMLGAIIRQMGLFDGTEANNQKIQTIIDSIIIKKDSDLTIVSKDRQGFLHPNSDALRKVLEAVQDHQPKMIVFDPISSFWGSEAALNDMSKAVIKFMSTVVDHSGASVEMINHMGKSSSNVKDMTQFAGRGGSGLPSNSRISRTLRQVFDDEFTQMTGESLANNQTAMLCNVNKFSDGSPLFNVPFLIVREGYLFSRKPLTPAKQKEAQNALSDLERVMDFIKRERANGKYPTKSIVLGHFLMCGDPIPKTRSTIALQQLSYQGVLGERVKLIDNPDLTQREKAYVVTDENGAEIT